MLLLLLSPEEVDDAEGPVERTVNIMPVSVSLDLKKGDLVAESFLNSWPLILLKLKINVKTSFSVCFKKLKVLTYNTSSYALPIVKAIMAKTPIDHQ